MAKKNSQKEGVTARCNGGWWCYSEHVMVQGAVAAYATVNLLHLDVAVGGSLACKQNWEATTARSYMCHYPEDVWLQATISSMRLEKLVTSGKWVMWQHPKTLQWCHLGMHVPGSYKPSYIFLEVKRIINQSCHWSIFRIIYF